MNHTDRAEHGAGAIHGNIRVLMIEAFCSAVFAACVAYNIPYLLRLGAANAGVSVLLAGAGLVQVLATLPFAAWMQRSSHRFGWMLACVALIRLGHVIFLVAPGLGNWRSEVVICVLIMLNIPVALVGAIWLPLQADIIPVERRAVVFARRNIITSITMLATSVLLSRWLDLAPFPANYQWLYGLAIVTGLGTTAALMRVQQPLTAAAGASRPVRGAPAWHTWIRILQANMPFRKLLVNTLLFTAPVLVATPVQPIYFVRDLQVSDGWLGLWAACISGGGIVGNLLWQRVIERYGPTRTLVYAALPNAIYFVLIALFPNPTLILGFAVLAGVLNPGIDLGTTTALYTHSPTAQRTLLLGIYTTMNSVLAVVMPLVALPLIEIMDARVLLLLLAGLRFAAATLFVFRPLAAETELAA